MKLVRIGLSGLPAIGMTLGILLFMVSLVGLNKDAIAMPDTKDPVPLDIFMGEKGIGTNRKPVVEKPERLDPVTPPPEVPEVMIDAKDFAPAPDRPSFTAFTMDTGEGLDITVGEQPGDSFTPKTRISPTYPHRAKVRGIEGHVTVMFTVNEQGQTQDWVIVEANPKGVFDDAAIKAVSKWRYNPHMQDGESVASRRCTGQVSVCVKSVKVTRQSKSS